MSNPFPRFLFVAVLFLFAVRLFGQAPAVSRPRPVLSPASGSGGSLQCLFGIYFPNAFSPDGNGTNDIYRPVVLGNMIRYRLQVFNRWGQLVFATEDYSRGWDGSMNGTMQPTGTYVWMCQYQFAGETGKTEKGVLLLIR